MRRLAGLLLLPLLGGLPSLPARGADDPPKPAAHAGRVTWEQRFTQANLAHDGHLTLEEAKTGYPLLAKHFDDIDVDHKGYATENDVRAWRVMRKAVHRLGKPVDDRMKPQNAMQFLPVKPKPLNTSATQLVPQAPAPTGGVVVSK